ncbi:acetyl-coenzyme A synthetase [Halalkalicoccus paucihalophilus]|uniref:Acetyl-coenzyme A synthetase n=1 Tax=Halalkalicoccus paucihalophilus TaxID=1008153 RepID=A0A151AI96_9EURY|nr:long-chain fatty acid--CoA ligase [Halalkalicoccus paucihalophilus]KYH27371.1 acetyl-coenzyme A synthetase [Halalkalicoccus paucihalophilus]
MTNLVTEVGAVAEQTPDGTAIGYEGREISYGEFWARTGGFAAALDERGIGADDRVGVYLPNLPQFPVAFHGILRAGGVVVPMNPQYKAREIGHLLADSGAKAVVTLSDLVPFVEEVREETDVETVVSVGGGAEGAIPFGEFLADEEFDVAQRADDDDAVQPYTSGTTGQPKGVQLTHENLATNAEASVAVIPDGIRADDTMLGVLPLFHIYGMTVTMNATLFAGGAYYPRPSWDAGEATSLIEEEELTLMHGVPAMYNDVINQPDAEEFDLSSLRLAGVGGAGIPIEVLRRFEELYDVTVCEGYGLTETSPVTHFNSPNDRRVGSIGKSLPGIDSRVVTEDFADVPPVERGPVDEEAVDLNEITGELVIAGPNVMKGYYGLPEANEEAFTEEGGRKWFHTGDIGYHDEDGFYYVVDREKHMIVTAGYNVYPREVEELLFEHEAVADAAVVGIPDERRGETIKAYVVPTSDADVSEDDIKEYCLSSLAEYKHPREVEFVEELPRTTTGKVQKFKLEEREVEAE